MAKVDTVFSGSIPSTYDKYLGPLIFEPYAQDLATRLSALNAERVLETAAGTGIVTRALNRSLRIHGALNSASRRRVTKCRRNSRRRSSAR